MRSVLRMALPGSLLVLALGCAGRPGIGDIPNVEGYTEKGQASWYGKKYHGRATASGERYDMYAMTAAHRTLPFGVLVEVTNLENRRTVRVRITDRGPFKKGRIIDLSFAAARKLRMIGPGVVPVKIVVIEE